MKSENWRQGYYLVGSEQVQVYCGSHNGKSVYDYRPVSWPEGAWKPKYSCAVEFMEDHRGRITHMRNAVSKEFLTNWPKADDPARVDQVNPAHYKTGELEVWHMMIKVYGIEAYLNFAKLNAFKYRMRAGLKAGADVQTDINKALWYESKIKELTEKSNTNQ
jgi:hypothetical protein